MVKNPTKALWVKANPWAFIFNMKNILFFKMYYYLWDGLEDLNGQQSEQARQTEQAQ